MFGIKYTEIKTLQFLSKGKVRDIYNWDEDKLLIISTDRISAYDFVMNEPIPGRGKVLNQLSNFWKNNLTDIVKNDILIEEVENMYKLTLFEREIFSKRAVVVKKLKTYPVEFIVRGYLAGSGWRSYQKNFKINDIILPRGLKLADKFPQPIFTPTTKADVGHDEPLTWEETKNILGAEKAEKLKNISIKIYKKISELAFSKGIIIADTKFEFGYDENNDIILIDEVLTPDSSRFWMAQNVIPGQNPPSMDKQILRDWLDNSNWNKTPPPPKLSKELISKIQDKYLEIERKLTKINV